jgi:hypothetical protein
MRESGAEMVRVPALTAFKFPAIARPNVYRERPSHEQEAYLRRIEREPLFIERELAGIAARRLSPLKQRLPKPEEPTSREMVDPTARSAYLRRIRGLD